MPIQRQFVRVQLEIISILLELLQIQADEMFNKRLRRKRTHATYLVRDKLNIQALLYKII